MNALIQAAFSRNRSAVLALLFILLAGASAYLTIPKEADPDVAIPWVYVLMTHDGISPEDAERLLVRPMEKELQSIEGLKQMTAAASEGHASVLLEFDAGFDADQALQDVREKVDIAKAELPAETEEPSVNEVNVALFPVITLVLSGPVPERTLVEVGRSLRDRIEALPGVLAVEIGGDRIELMEVVVDPLVMETYGIRYEDLFTLISRNNRLVAAGAVDTGAGRMVLKVPGVIESIEDVMGLPVKVAGDRVVTFGDVASVRRAFRDPDGFARVAGQGAISLEVKKRIGANIIETIAEIRALVEEARQRWPGEIRVSYLQDKSEDIRDVLGDLQNNVLTAVVLVMIVVLAALGLRSALLVGVAIPGSFLAGILVISALGYTLNIIVLFSLILVAGMLVDGAIVVTELANRNLAAGLPAMRAYARAAQRMAWPVTASTATTLAVFLPLLFWPDVVGDFMKYLPITVIACLSASLAMALIFVPVLGGIAGGGRRADTAASAASPGGRLYRRLLARLLQWPLSTLLVSLLLIAIAFLAYGAFGRGVEFFPDIEPKFAQIQVQARGDLSVFEKDDLVRNVEQRILDMDELRVVYGRTFGVPQSTFAEDVIGVVQLEFVDWQRRRKAEAIMAEIRRRTADIAGVQVQVRKQDMGPGGGKPVQIQLSARDPDRLDAATSDLRARMTEAGGFADIEDNRPLPGIEWRLAVDRERAAQYGADVTLLGNAVQLLTAGVKIAGYRPDDSDEELDIRVRFPFADRNLDKLDQLRVPTALGMVPIGNFVTLEPKPRTGTLNRVDGRRAITVSADVRAGELVDDRVRALKSLLASDWDPAVELRFKGEDEEMRNAMSFLLKAFIGAVFLMLIILVTQFNSVYQALLVLSAVVFSTAGVLLGLLVNDQPFGVVMVGIGIIALAGIVVNNNIVLIDTYNRFRADGMAPLEAALETGGRRLRPVVLTALTTVLGLMPMVLSMNIDLTGRELTFDAPSTQWWTQLSSAIAGGLAFATLLTLLLTPCLLILGDRIGGRREPVDTVTDGVAEVT